MGTYFYDATLDKTYSDLISATTTLCGNIGGTGLRHIHNALLSKAGLTRTTTPKTPGDYLKGIAICARKIAGHTNYLTEKSTLAQIVTCLKNPVSSDPGYVEYTFRYSSSLEQLVLTLDYENVNPNAIIGSVSYTVKNVEGTAVSSGTFTGTQLLWPESPVVEGYYYITFKVHYTLDGESAYFEQTTSDAYYTPPQEEEEEYPSKSTVTKYGYTVTLDDTGMLTIEGNSYDYYNVYFWQEGGFEIFSELGKYSSSEDYSAYLAARGFVYAILEIVLESGDMYTIEVGPVFFP